MTIQALGTYLQLLQHFELRRANMPVALPETAQRLLALLAVRQGPQHRVQVAGTLWMDTSDEKASANLRTAIWRARRVDRDLVVSTGPYLAIGPEVHVDLTAVVDRARRLLDQSSGDIEDPQWCADSLAGELLPEWYDDWLLLERERLRQIRLHSLEALCNRLSELGQYSVAIQAGLIAASAEPLRESAHRALIGAHLAEGNMVEAIRQYDTFASLLSEHLGIRPSDRLRALVSPCR
jgi:DNA-binding SARP family transcriptional activator